MLGSSGHAKLRAAGLGQDAQGLLIAVAGEEGTLLGIAHRNTETGGDIGRQVEGGVVQELVGDLDHGAKLIGRQRGLAEPGVGLRNLLAFIDPLRFHGVGRNRDLAGAGISADDGGELAEDVVLLQRLEQQEAFDAALSAPTSRPVKGMPQSHQAPKAVFQKASLYSSDAVPSAFGA